MRPSSFAALLAVGPALLVAGGFMISACTTTTATSQVADEDAGTPTEDSEPSPDPDAEGGSTKDAGKKACSLHGGTCEDNAGCCDDAPFCSSTGKCCVGEGMVQNRYTCATGDDCCSGVCDTSRSLCCAFQGQACSPGSECCPGYTCGTDRKCGLALGEDCAGGQACAKGLLCANKVRELGGGSSTADPNKCCRPATQPCATSEDCCIEPGARGGDCVQGTCRRTIGSPCTKDEECDYRCRDGKCN